MAANANVESTNSTGTALLAKFAVFKRRGIDMNQQHVGIANCALEFEVSISNTTPRCSPALSRATAGPSATAAPGALRRTGGAMRRWPGRILPMTRQQARPPAALAPAAGSPLPD
jgi:hypothetical protein